MKKYWLRIDFWDVYIHVLMARCMGLPKWSYAWAQTRLNLIKKGEI